MPTGGPNRAFSALFCETSGVLCDHKLFIGGDDKDFNLAAGLGNLNIFAARAIAVQLKIDFNAEVIKAVQDALTHSLVVFANACGEHDCINAVECRGICADVFFDLVCKSPKRKLCTLSC